MGPHSYPKQHKQLQKSASILTLSYLTCFKSRGQENAGKPSLCCQFCVPVNAVR